MLCEMYNYDNNKVMKKCCFFRMLILKEINILLLMKIIIKYKNKTHLPFIVYLFRYLYRYN